MRAWIRRRRAPIVVLIATLGAMAVVASGASATSRDHHPGSGGNDRGRGWGGHGQNGGSGGDRHVFINRIFASGDGITHGTPSGSEQISQPDDITRLGGHIYVAFQNGVGPQGQPSTTGNPDSTIVEFNRRGRAVKQWDLTGKCDGLTADPQLGSVIATVNEDANSSLYLIDPDGGVTHFNYNSDPLPSNGGTDAITIYHGLVLISASAPGTTGAGAPQPTYPAVYEAAFDFGNGVVTLTPLFFDEDQATLANVNTPGFGMPQKLGLTDPDSSERVPGYADRFGGDFMLTSQGDQEQIFVHHAGRPDQSLSVLKLSSSVDDTAWPSSPNGELLTTDNSNNTINEITGPFRPGSVFVADTPCDQNNAPATCPGPGFPPNFLGELNPFTGQIAPVDLAGPAVEPQGMLFLPGSRGYYRDR
jgi:hypothetical protein